MSTSTTIPTEFKSQLEQAGFSPAGTGTFRNEQFELRLEEGWGVLSRFMPALIWSRCRRPATYPGFGNLSVQTRNM